MAKEKSAKENLGPSGIPPESLEQYEKILATVPGLTRKGNTMPYTSFNGNMFSYLESQGALALRLAKDEREIFLKKHNTRLCEAHGVVMKEYVLVPEEIFSDLKAMKKYFRLSYEYAKTLKPKPTKK